MEVKEKIIFLVFLLFAGLVVILTLRDYGISWDEPLYYQAGDSYIQSIFDNPASLFNSEKRDYYWQPNAQHPPLVKILGGLSHRIFGSWISDYCSYRLAEVFWYLLLIILVFYAGRTFINPRTGWLAAISTAFLPRLFGHAHLLELDLPLTTGWLLILICFYQGIENNNKISNTFNPLAKTSYISREKWSILTGLCFGICLLIKVTAVLLFIPLIIWSLFYARKRLTHNLFFMLFLGFPVFILFWPWLWNNPFGRIVEYYEIFFSFKSPLQTFYFGKAYSSTPWHYPLLMTIFTTPIVVLISSFYGLMKLKDRCQKNLLSSGRDSLYQGLQQPNDIKWISLLIINILFFWFLFALPGTLIIDGERYFMPIYPLLALLSGMGLDLFITKLNLKSCFKGYLIGIILSAYPLIFIILLHPCELSYFNILVGGTPGAKAIGMETTYWGELLGSKERNYINQSFPPNAKIKFLPFYPAKAPIEALSFYPDVVVYYQEKGYLRKDLQFFAPPPYDGFILISREGLFDPNCWNLSNIKPPYILQRFGVQYLGIYKK